MSTERRYQIFVSSTYRDLKLERDKLLRTLAEFDYIPAGMEYFPAVDEEQFKFIKRVIDQSDYYVVILGGLYGSLAPDGKSYTEKEYEYALKIGIPVCALLRNDYALLPENKRETESDKILLFERFRGRLAEARLVSFWNDENELSLKLVQSLSVTAKTYPAAGWVRGGDEEPLELLRKIQALEVENEALKERIESIKSQPVTEEMRTLLASPLEIPYTSKTHDRYGMHTHNHLLKTTWGNVAAAILPKFIAPVGGPYLTVAIENWIKDFTGRSGVDVKTELTDTIKMTFAAYNLIHCRPGQKVGGGVIEFIEITELGTRIMTALKLKEAGVPTPA